MTPLRSLASRMLVVALAQMLLVAAAAVIIFALTAPSHGGPAPGHHGPPPGPMLGPDSGMPFGPLLTLAVCAAVLVIGSVLTARWIVRPLQQLSVTARALGEGKLSARSGLVRNDEIGQLGRRIDQMAEQIERMLATERELLANVAHELRTPLSRIGVALDLAGEGDGQRARASLGEIAIDVAELERLVDDILTALRYDLARGTVMPLHRARTSPAKVANAAAERVHARYPDRPIALSIADDLPDIDVDPVMFRRVIENLLDNAHKYTPERTTPIELAVRAAAGRVEIDVIDRGIGIVSDDLPNVYNAFFRAERSRSRETGGVGLGLTLCKRIVDAHGGTIEITSSSHGTRARVTIQAL